MSRYLLTHSLLSSWLHGIKENPFEDATTERDAYSEFLDYLNKVETPPTEAMLNGMEFEKLVTDIATGRFVPEFETDGTVNKSSYGNGELMGYDKYPRWYDAACKVAGVVRGGQFQFKARKYVTVNGIDFLLFGKLDVLKAGDIDDIKFSKSYDRGKYFGSTQHPMYLELVPEARRFNYLVSNGTDVWTETYTREETPDIYPIISDFVDWITEQGLISIYKEKWEAK